VTNRAVAERVDAIDVLRGLAIGAMILVNNPGSWGQVYAPLLHAQWHGLTPTDVIFPAFIFVMGLSLSYSLPRQLKQQGAKLSWFNACRRSLSLFFLGLFLAVFFYDFRVSDYPWWHARIENLRVMGVLQRLALVYLATFMIVSLCRWRGQILTMLVLLSTYTLVMCYLPYGDNEGQTYQGLWLFANSAAAYIDHTVLGVNHVYYGHGEPFAFDPEGLLSTLPAIASCLAGVLCGQWLQATEQDAQRRYQGLIGVAIVAIGIGWGLHPWLPMNKALWTPSFVMVTSGIVMLILTGLMGLLRFSWGQFWCRPLVICGANSIGFFMLAGILGRLVIMFPAGELSLKGAIYQTYLLAYLPPKMASLGFAIGFLLLCYLPIYLMYKRNIFWRV
jgi:predicted acyltransferase